MAWMQEGLVLACAQGLLVCGLATPDGSGVFAVTEGVPLAHCEEQEKHITVPCPLWRGDESSVQGTRHPFLSH